MRRGVLALSAATLAMALFAIGQIQAPVPVTREAAAAQTFRMRLQAAVPSGADEFVLLKRLADRVNKMSDGRLEIEVLADGAVVGAFEILDAVHKGLVEAGFAWTHYWSGKHPAAVLFGSPPAGAGTGLDQWAFMSWYLEGGGKELYRELFRDHLKVNVIGFLIQPVGPEALGWFKKPINSVEDLRKTRFRTPPGLTGAIYKEMGVPAVSLSGAEIMPAAERGVLDAAEWCCPATDLAYGFHRVFKNYYLQGLHQSTVVGDIYINADFWKKLPADLQAIVENAGIAAMMETMAYRIRQNAVALKKLKEEHGVKVHDTPKDYFPAFLKATRKVMEENAAKDPFFNKVLKSQKDFAEIVVPYWVNVQKLSVLVGETALK